jgi:GNAT superfamily N-acetyltransferase
MISDISYEECLTLWNLLWSSRKTPIEPTSHMILRSQEQIDTSNSIYAYSNDIGDPTFLGYFLDGRLVGVNSYHRIDTTIRSRGLYVLDSYRGKGIANQLLGEVIRRAKIDSMVWSFPKDSALSVYLRVGFELNSLACYDPLDQKTNYYVTTVRK